MFIDNIYRLYTYRLVYTSKYTRTLYIYNEVLHIILILVALIRR